MHNPFEGVESLSEEVSKLRSDPEVREMVDNRLKEFIEVMKSDTNSWFNELVYCLLTANSSAKKGQECVDALCGLNIVLDGTLEEVSQTLKSQGHRFPNRRAEFILLARHLAPSLKATIQKFDGTKEARKWLVENVKGLGWKESSHFLRNVGYFDVAIIDRHILTNMRDHGLTIIDGKKGITKKRYLEYEKILEKVAEKVDMTLGEMDLYLWYNKTGKVLK